MSARDDLTAALSELRRASSDHHKALRDLTQLELRADQQQIKAIELMLDGTRASLIAQAQADWAATAEQTDHARATAQRALEARERAQLATMGALREWAT